MILKLFFIAKVFEISNKRLKFFFINVLFLEHNFIFTCYVDVWSHLVYNLLFRTLESQTLILTANSTAVKTYIYCTGKTLKIFRNWRISIVNTLWARFEGFQNKPSQSKHQKILISRDDIVFFSHILKFELKIKSNIVASVPS